MLESRWDYCSNEVDLGLNLIEFNQEKNILLFVRFESAKHITSLCAHYAHYADYANL